MLSIWWSQLTEPLLWTESLFVLGAILIVLYKRLKRPSSMVLKRLWLKYLVYYVFVHLTLAFLVIGGLWLQVALLVLSSLFVWELSRSFALLSPEYLVPIMLASLAMTLSSRPETALMILVFSLVLIFSLPVVKGKPDAHHRPAKSLLILCLSGLFPVHLLWMREDFLLAAPFFFLTLAVGDAFAELLGRLMGRRSLLRSISPAKTTEGALGGLGAASLASLAFSDLFPFEESRLTFIFLGVLVGLLGQLGDLAFSALKRSQEIKDFFFLLLGHGGLLDRFDSLLLAVPVLYWLLRLWRGV